MTDTPRTSSPARRVLGVDAGGTGTRAVVVEGDQVVDRIELGPLNILLHADSAARLAAVISETGVDGAGLGLAGVQSVGDAESVLAVLRTHTSVPIAVTDDSEVAVLGAFDGKSGGVVIAGTGSIACGRDDNGRVLRVGGHGFLLGDDGAGYWIGRECVRAALREADGSGPATSATAVVQQVFGDDVRDAVRRIHEFPTDRELLSCLVPIAAAAADAVADEVIEGIFTSAAAHLARLADTLRKHLGPIQVAMVGGVFRVATVRAAFVAATGAVPALGPPEIGAVRYAQLKLHEEMAVNDRS
ncbi:MAG: BadF/BadG/BcrA/BcrD ATPase family protein [Mycobacteriales bacterium]